MYEPNNQASYTNHPYFPGQSMLPSIHNPSFSYPPQFQSLSSNPSVSLPLYGYTPGSSPEQYPSNIPCFGAQPVYSDPGAASANWVVKQSAPVTYSVHNLLEITKIEEPWCDVCKISCTSNDCLNMHLVGKKHQKNLRKLQKPNNTVSTVASLPLIIPTTAAAKTPFPVSTGETNAQYNLSKKRKIEEPWCDVCKISCTSNDGLNMHLVGKKHQKNLQKLQNPINIV